MVHPVRHANDSALIDRFAAARHDPELVVIEGFHALKHALRFNAVVVEVLTPDAYALTELTRRLAPDLGAVIPELARPIAPAVFAQLAPQAPRTGTMAIARRPREDVARALASTRPAPVVLLEEPRHLGNLGACVRVAAAADAAAVLTTGTSDPWHPEAVRGGAGLQFALPVARVTTMPRGDRPLVALDPDGEELRPARLAPRSVLVFGTERHGLSDAVLDAADAQLRIPMRPGVSSLNLATSVAAVLFAWRLVGQ